MSRSVFYPIHRADGSWAVNHIRDGRWVQTITEAAGHEPILSASHAEDIAAELSVWAIALNIDCAQTTLPTTPPPPLQP